MDGYYGIVFEKYGDTYITPKKGHIAKNKNDGKQTYLVKVSYDGKVISENPINYNKLPGFRLSLKALFDPNMKILATPNKLKAGGSKNIPVGAGVELSDVINKLNNYAKRAEPKKQKAQEVYKPV